MVRANGTFALLPAIALTYRGFRSSLAILEHGTGSGCDLSERSLCIAINPEKPETCYDETCFGWSAPRGIRPLTF